MCMTKADFRRQDGTGSLVLCVLSHSFVHLVHVRFYLGGQRPEVVLVRHVAGVDRLKDAHRGAPGKEDLGSRSRGSFRSLDDHRKEREAGVDRDPEGSFVEWEEFTILAAGSLGKYEQRIASLGRDAYTFIDGMARGPSLLAVDLDDADRSHRPSDERDPEDLLFGEEPTMERQVAHQERDVEHGEMVRGYDISHAGVDLVEAEELHAKGWDLQEEG